MKILLLGDYYEVNKTLAKELIDKGHQVRLYGLNSGWEKKLNEIEYKNNKLLSSFKTFKRNIYVLKHILNFRSYDVVQLASPDFVNVSSSLFFMIFNFLKKYNKKVFLCGYGLNSYLVLMYLKDKNIKYSELFLNNKFRDHIDNRRMLDYYLDESRFKINQYIAKSCDGIIVPKYENFIAYKRFFSCKTQFIPFPVDIPTYSYENPYIQKNPPDILNICLNIRRYHEELKGRDEVYKVLFRVNSENPLDAHVIYNIYEYYNPFKAKLNGFDILIDNILSYSPDINELRAMSNGTVIMCGCNEQFYNIIGENKLRPMINVIPEEENIRNTLLYYIKNPQEVKKLSQEGIEFIKKYFNPSVVADQYIGFWESR